MATSGSSPAEIRSSVVAANINGSTKKRKFIDEQTNMPLVKHVCRYPSEELNSSSDSSTEPNEEAGSNEFSIAVESNLDSALDNNTDSMIISTNDEPKPDHTNQRICASYEPSTSSPSWSRDFYPHNQSTATDSVSLDDCSCSDYRDDNINIADCMDTELENLFCSNGIDPNNYILSSGRWSVNRDDRNRGEKLTIDKEFEQYFSMLML